MSERGAACAIGEEARFARLAAAARPFTRSEAAAFLAELGEAVRREAELRDDRNADEIDSEPRKSRKMAAPAALDAPPSLSRS